MRKCTVTETTAVFAWHVATTPKQSPYQDAILTPVADWVTSKGRATQVLVFDSADGVTPDTVSSVVSQIRRTAKAMGQSVRIVTRVAGTNDAPATLEGKIKKGQKLDLYVKHLGAYTPRAAKAEVAAAA